MIPKRMSTLTCHNCNNKSSNSSSHRMKGMVCILLWSLEVFQARLMRKNWGWSYLSYKIEIWWRTLTVMSSAGWWTQATCTTLLTTIITRFHASLFRSLPIWDVEILETEPTDLIDLFQYLAAIDLIIQCIYFPLRTSRLHSIRKTRLVIRWHDALLYIRLIFRTALFSPSQAPGPGFDTLLSDKYSQLLTLKLILKSTVEKLDLYVISEKNLLFCVLAERYFP